MTMQAPPITETEYSEAKKIIEALLFATSEPISISKLKEVIDSTIPIKTRDVKKILQELQQEYAQGNRAFCLEEIAEGYVLRSKAEYAPYVQLLFSSRKKERLSQKAMEVLAIIAYKQPITKPQIEAIRGVDSSGVVYTLLDRNLIEVVGKLEVLGRPSLYATTKEFLKYFGLKSLSDLPEHAPLAVQQ